MITIKLHYYLFKMKSKFIKRYVYNRYFEAIKTHNHLMLKHIVRCFPATLDSINALGLNGLMQAVASRNYEAITYLLESGIDPNIMDQDGWSAKAWAILMNDHESLKRLSTVSVLTHSKHNNVCGMGLVAVGTVLSQPIKSKVGH